MTPKAAFLIFIWISFFSACVTSPPPSQTTPSAVIIRNSTGFHIEEVEIQEVKKGRGPARIGIIAPVPPGASQRIGRQKNAPKLPRQVMVCWTIQRAEPICRQKEIPPGVRSAPNSSVVIDIIRPDAAKIYIENRP